MPRALSIADQVALARRHERDLPPVPFEGRWVPSKKEAVVDALRRRLLTEAQVMEAWGVTEEELESWIRRHERFGRRGLEVGRLQMAGRLT